MKTISQNNLNDSSSNLVAKLKTSSITKPVISRLTLELLVDELIKSNPDQVLVRAQMHAAGLKYSNDAVLSMSLVLQALENGKTVSADQCNDSGGSASHGVFSENHNVEAGSSLDRANKKTKQNSTAPKRRERDNVQDL